MSKFFRSSASTSSSEDESDGEIGHDLSLNSSGDTETIASDLAQLRIPDQSVPVDSQNSQLLLAALLEERCMNEVLREFQDQRQHAWIQQEARRRYLRLSTTLAHHNLISTGLDHADLTPTRQRVRDGLDLLSRSNLAAPQNVPAPLRRLLTDTASDASPTADLLLLSRQSTSASSVFDEISSARHPVLNPSRYTRDFDELGMLGKGGYGMVFHVKHKLDDVQYAIKKIPISAARVARMRTRGQAEVDDLTREVRTLARLDHPNIVRYHAAWVEWSDVGRVPSASNTPDAAVQTHKSETASADDSNSKASLQRVATASDSEEHTGIVFESSTSAPRLDNPESSAQVSFANQTSTNFSTSYTDGALLRTTEPTLALHLQMGLYPLTLSDFISPPPSSIEPLAHCFHLRPSISILTSLISGVKYLHDQGIVHRDLKPANIFLSASTAPTTRKSSVVDLSLCDHASCHQTPITLSVRIGDFGLVSEIARPETTTASPPTSTAPVGTEIYRPLSRHYGADGYHAGEKMVSAINNSKSLDVFALGIIFFEMLCRFSTRMERHDIISRLKHHGVFPEGFGEGCGNAEGDDGAVAGKLRKVIGEMLECMMHEVGLDDLEGRVMGLM